jgi:non-specific serine/threonine protein kinase
LTEKEMALCDRLDNKNMQIIVRLRRGDLAINLGNVEGGVTLLEEGVVLARDFGSKWLLAQMLNDLGDAVRIQGDYARASSLYKESIGLHEELGDKWRLSAAFRNMGIVLLRQRKYAGAATFFADSIGHRDPAKNRWVVFQGLEGLACVACAQGQHMRAATLFGAAKPIQEFLQSKREIDYQAEVDQYLDRTRFSLGEAAYETAHGQGRAMTLDKAVEYALTFAREGSTGQRSHARRPDDDLTAREREVVGLVALGLTNREIATTLMVSGRTAEAHIQNILNKLGYRSRAQIAAWAVERGLKENHETEAAALPAPPSKARRAT